MTVPFLDVNAGYNELKFEIDDAVQTVMSRGNYILGDEVLRFESKWAKFCNADHCVAVGNGYDALYLALLAAGVGHGDEVIVPSNTFIATWMAVRSVGATIVPVEPDPISHLIDASKVAPAITSSTRAIIPVHLYGHPVDLFPIMDLVAGRSIVVIEDAAQAHGAYYRGGLIGKHGDMVAWSFYPGKNLGAFGDAGGVTTNSADYALKIARHRNYGFEAKNSSRLFGVNSRMDELQAATLSVKLEVLERWNARRAEIASIYLATIEAGRDGVHLKTSPRRSSRLGFGITAWPSVAHWAEPAWHLFVVQTDDRPAMAKFLKNQGVEFGVHYPIPPHRQRAFSSFERKALPIADVLANRVISLPIGPHLSAAQTEKVNDVLSQIPVIG